MLRPETPQAAADAAADVADEVTGDTPDTEETRSPALLTPSARERPRMPPGASRRTCRGKRTGRPSSIRAESTVRPQSDATGSN